MKRNISDLLDQYPAEDVELGGNTPYSHTRIKEITMNQIHTENNTNKSVRRFKPARLLIAAAVVAALSVSAFAADRIFGAGELFQDFFAREGGSLSQGQLDTIDQLGHVAGEAAASLPPAVTDNGATITPIAALADENIYYLRLRVEAPEGTALPDSEPNDNIKEFIVQFTNLSDGGITLNDGVSKVLTFHGLWIQDADKGYTPVFTGKFAFDIGLNFQSQAIQLPVEGLTWHDDLLDYTNTLQAVTMTPLSLSYRVDCAMPENDHIGAQLGDLEIVLKDGTVFYSEVNTTEDDEALTGYIREMGITLPLTGEPTGVFENYIPFDQPLDLSQVDYVQYGDNKIPVDAG